MAIETVLEISDVSAALKGHRMLVFFISANETVSALEKYF